MSQNFERAFKVSEEQEARASVDEERDAVLACALQLAPFDGWTTAMLNEAVRDAGTTPRNSEDGQLALLFPSGVADILDYWASKEDSAMAAAFDALHEPIMRIRDKITWLVRQRIEQLNPNREAARRAAATLALPNFTGIGPRLLWRTAGQMWVAIGDQSEDMSFYTKRATLSGVYGTTLARWFAEGGDGFGDVDASSTWTFLDRRIENVMQLEKVKASMRKVIPDPDGIAGLKGRFSVRQ